MECGEQTMYCAFERIWPWVVLLIIFLWIPLRDLETWNYGVFSFFACGQAFFLLDRFIPPFSKGFWGDLQDMTRVYIFEKVISVGRIRSRVFKQSDMGFYWWRNVWRRWMLKSKLKLSISRHWKASKWGQMQRGKWSVLKCHYFIRAQVLTKLNTTI